MRDNGTKFSGGKTAPGIKFSIGENSAADTCTVCQADKFFIAFSRAKYGLADGGGIDIIFYTGGYMKFLLHDFLQFGSSVAGNIFVCVDNLAADRVNLSGSADADALKCTVLLIICDNLLCAVYHMGAALVGFGRGLPYVCECPVNV